MNGVDDQKENAKNGGNGPGLDFLAVGAAGHTDQDPHPYREKMLDPEKEEEPAIREKPEGRMGLSQQ